MVFGILKSDEKVFTGDKIRFNAEETFAAPGVTITLYEISVDNGSTYYDITAKKMVDWIFSSAGTKNIILKVTASSGVQTFPKDIEVLDLTAAKLFSKDNDLFAYEPDIYKYLPKKWSSWNALHYEAQKYILQWLDDKGVLDKNGESYGVDDILDIKQVREFSMMKVIQLIYQGNSNQAGDIFSINAEKYTILVDEKAAKTYLRLDFNKNGELDPNEGTNLRSVGLIRG